MTLRHLLSSCCLALLPVVAGGVAQANPYADHLAVRLLPGWKQADGSHIAGLEFQLSQGWKTYWRAPGDAGVPPVFDWSASQNVARVDVIWPTPHVFWQNGMRSIGYSDRVVLPLRIEPSGSGAVHLDGVLQVGICSDICVPLHVDLSALVLPPQGRRDPAIAASLAERPFSGAEAGVRDESDLTVHFPKIASGKNFKKNS
ncbi:MAG: protein-disulfide reductase DsbD domain-containing protein, partial [Pseudomonadota bacterium]|nr:protein-disulfide reductase DsbD domain-containing protein [Pseudomonadota bacterium]